jgi:integrase
MGRNRQWDGVRARSKNSIQIDFVYKGVRCRETIRLQPTPTNLRRAELHRAAILDGIARGTFDYAITFPDSPRRFLFVERKGEGYLLGEYLPTWLEKQKPHIKASTFDDYRKVVENTLVPAFGEIFLADLKRAHVREWCEPQNVTNKRLANVQSVLRQAMRDALDDELIEVNPLQGWKYAKKEAPKPVDDVDPFTADEQEAILLACSEPQHRNLFQFAFWTGLRTSELCALEWGDIDFRRGIVRVSRAKTQVADEAEGTKTRRGTRDVKLLPAAIAALSAQKPYSYLTGGAVFLNPRTGEPWAGDQPIRHGAWTTAMRRSGIRYRRPYQTRHTYASMMLTAGESPVWLANQMGHSDLTMIARTYGRWIVDALPDAGSKAVAMFDRSPILNSKKG